MQLQDPYPSARMSVQCVPLVTEGRTVTSVTLAAGQLETTGTRAPLVPRARPALLEPQVQTTVNVTTLGKPVTAPGALREPGPLPNPQALLIACPVLESAGRAILALQVPTSAVSASGILSHGVAVIEAALNSRSAECILQCPHEQYRYSSSALPCLRKLLA